MSPSYTDGIFARPQAIFTSQKYSDITVHCGFDKYLLHRAIICARSKFFDQACDQEFKEPNAVIVLDEDDPASVNRMLIFLYSNDYPDGAVPFDQRPLTISDPYIPPRLGHLMSSLSVSGNACPATVAEDKIMNNVLVHSIADKYGLPSLNILARERVQKLTQSPTAYTDMANLPQILRTVFGHDSEVNDHGMRDIFVQFCVGNIHELLSDAVVKDVIMEIGPLSFALMEKIRDLDHQNALERAVPRIAALETDLADTQSRLTESYDRENSVRIEKEAAIHSQETLTSKTKQAFDDKNKAFREKQEAIKAKEDSNREKNEAAREKDEAIKEMNMVIREKDNAINDKNNALKDKAQAIREKNDAISRKAFTINQGNQMLAERNQFLADRNTAFEGINQFLKTLDNFLSQSYRWQCCRNCSANFTSEGCYLQRSEGNGALRLQLRCCDCRCRHDVGAGNF